MIYVLSLAVHCLQIALQVNPEKFRHVHFKPKSDAVIFAIVGFQTKKISILPEFYFHDALEKLKTNFHTNFRFKRVLGFVIEYAWISKLLRDEGINMTAKGAVM